MRAAILTAMMSLTPAVPVDIFRFLRVPAIVFTLRAARPPALIAPPSGTYGCQVGGPAAGGARAASRWCGSRSRRSWSASAAAFRRR